MTEDIKQFGYGKLDEETQKVVKASIEEVLTDFSNNSKKYFTADVLHSIRMKITRLVHQRIGVDKIQSVDVGLNLENIENYDFFFKINIPKEEAEKQILGD
jgi:hypothetical protein